MFKLLLEKVENYIQLKHPNGEWVLMDRSCGKVIDRSMEQFAGIPVENGCGKYPPVVEVESLSFQESAFVANGKRWKAETLYNAAIKQNCIKFDLPLCGIDLRRMPFTIDNMDDFIYQFKRVVETDLENPIILDDKGFIADGWHRVVKAIIEERSSIKAYRLKDMPPCDGVDEETREK